MSNAIQEKFGQAVIDTIAEFVKHDIKQPADLENDEFVHISDPVLRRALAETLYGARYMYKLGLANIAENVDQYGIVRMQLIDYTSVCESILADMLVHAKNRGILGGNQVQYFDVKKRKKMVWGQSIQKTIHRTLFEWRIIVAKENGIIDHSLETYLNRIRTLRNSVHLTLKIMMNVKYYSSLAKRAYTTLYSTIEQTKTWKAANP